MANIVHRALTSLNKPSGNPGESRSLGFPFWPFNPLKGNFGAALGHNAALTLPAYYNAVEQITNDIAKLPKAVYKKTGTNREKLGQHPVTYLINRAPNKLMTAFTFHKMMAQAAINRGNGIALINRNPNTAAVTSLEFIHPDDVRDIKLISGELYYFIKDSVYTSDEVIHNTGYSDNGLVGVSVIKYAANVLGISLAAQKFSQETFENRGVGYAVIEADGDISATKKQEIENAVNSKLQGDGKIKSVMLDDGHKYKAIQINNQEAQLVEQGKLSIADICRFLNISPHKVKVLDDANYNALYMLNIEHASDSIQPWAIKFSQEYGRKLFTDNEKKDHYVKMNDNILLRADLKTKGEWYSKAVQAGIYTRNEIRAMEELNALDGLDEPLTPVNTQIPAQIQNNLDNE